MNFSLVPSPHRLRDRKGLLGSSSPFCLKTELFTSVLLFPGAWPVRRHRLTLVNMTIQNCINTAFKLLVYGTLFCHLTITGIVRFLTFRSFRVFVVLMILNILGFLKAYLFLETHVFQMLPLHGLFLLHNVVRCKQATTQFEQRSRK